MRRYDGSFGGGRGPRRGGYEWSRPPRETMGFGGWDPRDVQYGRWDVPPDYGRGVYGGGYEGPARGYAPRRGWAGYGAEFGDGPRAGYARQPFVPEHAYRRHPELDSEPRPRGRWGYEMDDGGLDLEDGEILDAVRRRLYDDVWLDIDRIDVEVEDGVVTLRGEVDDFLEARYAWDDAWETEGVRGVINQLTVRVDQPHDEHGDMVPQSAEGTRTEPVEE